MFRNFCFLPLFVVVISALFFGCQQRRDGGDGAAPAPTYVLPTASGFLSPTPLIPASQVGTPFQAGEISQGFFQANGAQAKLIAPINPFEEVLYVQQWFYKNENILDLNQITNTCNNYQSTMANEKRNAVVAVRFNPYKSDQKVIAKIQKVQAQVTSLLNPITVTQIQGQLTVTGQGGVSQRYPNVTSKMVDYIVQQMNVAGSNDGIVPQNVGIISLFDSNGIYMPMFCDIILGKASLDLQMSTNDGQSFSVRYGRAKYVWNLNEIP